MTSMLLWQIYLWGALIAAAVISVASDLYSDHLAPPRVRTGLVVLAGALWPVLLVGLLQFICIGVVSKVVSNRFAAERSVGITSGR